LDFVENDEKVNLKNFVSYKLLLIICSRKSGKKKQNQLQQTSITKAANMLGININVNNIK
jgi:hypothetical protein